MNRRLLTLPLILLLLFLSGCSSGSFNIFNPYTGSNGIQVSFMQGLPPNVAYSGIHYNVGLKLINYGALDADNAYLVMGTDDFGGALINSPTYTFNLKGKKNVHFFRGETNYKIFDAKAPNIGSRKEASVNVNYLLCYPYETKAQLSICITPNPNIYSNERSGCRYTPSVQVSPQGAPVDVVEVDETPVPVSDNEVKIRFKIIIKNLGNGFVVSKSNYKGVCDGNVNFKDFGKVDVSAYLSGKPLTCFPTKVTLSPRSSQPNTAVFSCVSDPMPIGASRVSLLDISLKYGYFLSGNKNLMVYSLS